MRFFRSLLLVFLASITATLQAQIVKGINFTLSVASDGALPRKEVLITVHGHSNVLGVSKISARFPSRGSVEYSVPMARPVDLREVKDIEIKQTLGDAAPWNITGVHATGVSVAQSGNALSADEARRTDVGFTFQLRSLEGLSTPFDASHPFTFRLRRTDLAESDRQHQRLRLELHSRDGLRGDSKLMCFIETTDARMIEMPIQDLPDNTNKTVTKNLSIPIAKKLIRRIHFWFSHLAYKTNRDLPAYRGPGGEPDDAELDYELYGEGQNDPPELLVRQVKIKLQNWENYVTRVLNSTPRTFPDEFFDRCSCLFQTGNLPLNTEERKEVVMVSAFSRFVVNPIVWVARDKAQHPVFPGALGSLTGSFKPGHMAFGEFNAGFSTRMLRLSELTRIEVETTFGNPSPVIRGGYSESWDMRGLVIGVRNKDFMTDNIFDQIAIIGDFSLNKNLLLEIDNGRQPHNIFQVPMDWRPIEYGVFAN